MIKSTIKTATGKPLFCAESLQLLEACSREMLAEPSILIERHYTPEQHAEQKAKYEKKISDLKAKGDTAAAARVEAKLTAHMQNDPTGQAGSNGPLNPKADSTGALPGQRGTARGNLANYFAKPVKAMPKYAGIGTKVAIAASHVAKLIGRKFLGIGPPPTKFHNTAGVQHAGWTSGEATDLPDTPEGYLHKDTFGKLYMVKDRRAFYPDIQKLGLSHDPKSDTVLGEHGATLKVVPPQDDGFFDKEGVQRGHYISGEQTSEQDTPDGVVHYEKASNRTYGVYKGRRFYLDPRKVTVSASGSQIKDEQGNKFKIKKSQGGGTFNLGSQTPAAPAKPAVPKGWVTSGPKQVPTVSTANGAQTTHTIDYDASTHADTPDGTIHNDNGDFYKVVNGRKHHADLDELGLYHDPATNQLISHDGKPPLQITPPIDDGFHSKEGVSRGHLTSGEKTTEPETPDGVVHKDSGTKRLFTVQHGRRAYINPAKAGWTRDAADPNVWHDKDAKEHIVAIPASGQPEKSQIPVGSVAPQPHQPPAQAAAGLNPMGNLPPAHPPHVAAANAALQQQHPAGPPVAGPASAPGGGLSPHSVSPNTHASASLSVIDHHNQDIDNNLDIWAKQLQSNKGKAKLSPAKHSDSAYRKAMMDHPNVIASIENGKIKIHGVKDSAGNWTGAHPDDKKAAEDRIGHFTTSKLSGGLAQDIAGKVNKMGGYDLDPSFTHDPDALKAYEADPKLNVEKGANGVHRIVGIKTVTGWQGKPKLTPAAPASVASKAPGAPAPTPAATPTPAPTAAHTPPQASPANPSTPAETNPAAEPAEEPAQSATKTPPQATKAPKKEEPEAPTSSKNEPVKSIPSATKTPHQAVKAPEPEAVDEPAAPEEPEKTVVAPIKHSADKTAEIPVVPTVTAKHPVQHSADKTAEMPVNRRRQPPGYKPTKVPLEPETPAPHKTAEVPAPMKGGWNNQSGNTAEFKPEFPTDKIPAQKPVTPSRAATQKVTEKPKSAKAAKATKMLGDIYKREAGRRFAKTTKPLTLPDVSAIKDLEQNPDFNIKRNLETGKPEMHGFRSRGKWHGVPKEAGAAPEQDIQPSDVEYNKPDTSAEGPPSKPPTNPNETRSSGGKLWRADPSGKKWVETASYQSNAAKASAAAKAPTEKIPAQPEAAKPLEPTPTPPTPSVVNKAPPEESAGAPEAKARNAGYLKHATEVATAGKPVHSQDAYHYDSKGNVTGERYDKVKGLDMEPTYLNMKKNVMNQYFLDAANKGHPVAHGKVYPGNKPGEREVQTTQSEYDKFDVDENGAIIGFKGVPLSKTKLPPQDNAPTPIAQSQAPVSQSAEAGTKTPARGTPRPPTIPADATPAPTGPKEKGATKGEKRNWNGQIWEWNGKEWEYSGMAEPQKESIDEALFMSLGLRKPLTAESEPALPPELLKPVKPVVPELPLEQGVGRLMVLSNMENASHFKDRDPAAHAHLSKQYGDDYADRYNAIKGHDAVGAAMDSVHKQLANFHGSLESVFDTAKKIGKKRKQKNK